MKNHQIAQILREERETRGMNKTEWALSLGVSDTAVGKWESGKSLPGAEQMAKLWKRYNIKPEDLLRWIGN